VDENEALKDAGIVLVYGCSDDLCEFEGAVYDETGASDGEIVYINEKGNVQFYKKLKGPCKKIKILWCPNEDMTWAYETDIPHETFYIMEDNEINCKAMLFYLRDCGPKAKYEVRMNGNAFEVWDIAHPSDKFPVCRVDTKGAYDDIHEPLAKFIATCLNYKDDNDLTFSEFLKEIGLD
jgi:hypothetical protein